MAVAVASLLIALVVPHHHHAGGICVAATECHVGQHGEGGADSRSAAPCIEKEAFIHAKKQATDNSLPATISPLLATQPEPAAATLRPGTRTAMAAGDAGETTPPMTAGQALRAPPAA